MNLVEILKNVPRGTTLYCTIGGVVKLDAIYFDSEYPIRCSNDTSSYNFTKDGTYYVDTPGAECVLFPSRENRDWSTFKVQTHDFKTFDKVLVRYNDESKWFPNIFAYSINTTKGTVAYYAIDGCLWEQCIPYKGNEHLVGKVS